MKSDILLNIFWHERIEDFLLFQV